MNLVCFLSECGILVNVQIEQGHGVPYSVRKIWAQLTVTRFKIKKRLLRGGFLLPREGEAGLTTHGLCRQLFFRSLRSRLMRHGSQGELVDTWRLENLKTENMGRTMKERPISSNSGLERRGGAREKWQFSIGSGRESL